MITQEYLEELEARVGKHIPTRFVEYLNDKGHRNGHGNPFVLPNLTPFWKGKKESLFLEKLLLDFEEDHHKKLLALEKRKEKLKNKVA